MNTVYVNDTDRSVSLTVPVTPNIGTMDVTVSKNGAVVEVIDTVTADGNTYSFDLPFSLCQSDNEYDINWKFSYDENSLTYDYDNTTQVEVVTPILPLATIGSILGDDLNTPEHTRTAEAAVRTIIQAHTGQKFGYSKNKTIVVEGHAERALRLPERLIALSGLSTLTAQLDIRAAIITSDGWYLKKSWSDSVFDIENDSLYWSGADYNFDNPAPGQPGYEKPSHGPIIDAPRIRVSPTRWRDDYPFSITGDWGYKSVPVDVQEAAKLLINDYACSEIAYRDRYLESIKASDWRLQFSSRAWEYTGNVRADQLLAQYVLLNWAVV